MAQPSFISDFLFFLKRYFFRIVLATIVLSIPFVFLTSFSYQLFDKQLSQLVLARRESLAYLAARTLQEKFDGFVKAGTIQASDPELQQALVRNDWETAMQLLKKSTATEGDIDRIVLVDKAGTIKNDYPAHPEIRGQNFASSQLYKGVASNWKPYVSEVSKRAASPQYNIVAIEVPIIAKTPHGDEILGIFVKQILLDQILAWSREITANDSTAIVYFVDQKGQLAGHPGYNPQGDIINYRSVLSTKEVMIGHHGMVTYHDTREGKDVVAAFAPVGHYGWEAVTAQQVSVAFAEKNKELKTILIVFYLVGGLIFLNGLLILWAISFLIIKNEKERTEEKALEAAKDEFLSTAAHQLRTPLGIMKWTMERLLNKKEGKLSVKIEKILWNMFGTNLGMIGLVNDLLDVSRITQGRVQDTPQETNITLIIENVILFLSPEAKKRHISMQLIKSTQTPMLMIDPNLFRQVIQNLLTNAIVYNRHHGRVTIIVNKQDSSISIEISDTGIGISRSDQKHIFDKFFRGENARKEKIEGTGLGLFIVKSYVDRWAGEIHLESTQGKGTTIRLVLPMRKEYYK